MPMGQATADAPLLNLLADAGPMGISNVAAHLEVTRTAVHERLLRLMAEGLVERQLLRGRRGRPSYQYSLSRKARQLAGNNFADLAAVLWREAAGVKDKKLRGRLIGRIAGALRALYEDKVQGTTLIARMESLRQLLEKRRVRCEVDSGDGLPSLTLRDCPYLELAEEDRGVCRMETILFGQLLGDDFRLWQCRLDGHSCCRFGPQGAARESRSVA